MADWYEMEGREGSFSVAGYNIIGGDWQNVETGGGTPFEDTPFDVSDVDRMTLHYVNPAGDDVYFTVLGPFDDWDSLVDYFDDMLDGYGVSE